jgi:multidrug transporter EmrE-like cation transporter
MKFGWIALAVSMLLDVFACLMAKQLDGWNRPGVLISVILGYGSSMWLFAWSLRVIPLGPAFAAWSGLGLILTAVLAIPIYGQKIDIAGALGMGLIMAGTVVLTTLSKMEVH